jgi:hypothetical protein
MTDDDYPRLGANIACCICGARPYPPEGVREDFDLLKLKADGSPAGEGEGAWYCSLHFQRVTRPKEGQAPYRLVAEGAP